MHATVRPRSCLPSSTRDRRAPSRAPRSRRPQRRASCARVPSALIKTRAPFTAVKSTGSSLVNPMPSGCGLDQARVRSRAFVMLIGATGPPVPRALNQQLMLRFQPVAFTANLQHDFSLRLNSPEISSADIGRRLAARSRQGQIASISRRSPPRVQLLGQRPSRRRSRHVAAEPGQTQDPKDLYNVRLT
jgi:hypothetical protein